MAVYTNSFGPTPSSISDNIYTSVINLIPILYNNNDYISQKDEIISNIYFALPLTSSKNQTYDISVIIFNQFDITKLGASWSTSTGSNYWNYNSTYYIHQSSSVSNYGFHNGGRVGTSSATSTIDTLFPNSSGILARFNFGNIGAKEGNFNLLASEALDITIYDNAIKNWTWQNSQGKSLGIGVYENNGYDYSSSSTTQHALRWQKGISTQLILQTTQGIIHYNNNGEWINCIPYYYDGEWKQCNPYCRDGSNWKQLG